MCDNRDARGQVPVPGKWLPGRLESVEADTGRCVTSWMDDRYQGWRPGAAQSHWTRRRWVAHDQQPRSIASAVLGMVRGGLTAPIYILDTLRESPVSSQIWCRPRHPPWLLGRSRFSVGSPHKSRPQGTDALFSGRCSRLPAAGKSPMHLAEQGFGVSDQPVISVGTTSASRRIGSPVPAVPGHGQKGFAGFSAQQSARCG